MDEAKRVNNAMTIPEKSESQNIASCLDLPEKSKTKNLSIDTFQKNSKSIGIDLTECGRPDGAHLYCETDLRILLARICHTVLTEGSTDFFSKIETNRITRELISDFEWRFECEFEDVRRANPNIKPGKTNIDNFIIASRYAHLKYSR